MPDFWTHIIGGEFVLDQIKNEKWRCTIKDKKKLFDLGCQGPDIFFYNDFWPWIKRKKGPEIGHKIHKKSGDEIILYGLKMIKEKRGLQKEVSNLIAYQAGMITHYALDQTLHPFINNFTDTDKEHKRLEINLDVELMRKYRDKKSYRSCPVSHIDLGDSLPSIIKRYYQEMFAQFDFDEEGTEVVDESYKDMKKVLNLFYTPRRLKVPFFKMVDIITFSDLSYLIYPKSSEKDLLSDQKLKILDNIFLQGVKKGDEFMEYAIEYSKDQISDKRLKDQIPKANFSGKKN